MVEACIWYFHEKKIGKLVGSYPLSEINQRLERCREGAISTIYYKASSAYCCQESCTEKNSNVHANLFYVNIEPKKQGHHIHLTLSLYTHYSYFSKPWLYLYSLQFLAMHFYFAFPCFTCNNIDRGYNRLKSFFLQIVMNLSQGFVTRDCPLRAKMKRK